MKIQIKHHDDIVIINMSGKVDGGPDCMLLKETVENLSAAEHRKLILNFSHVRWITSCGIGILISAKQLLDSLDGRIVLCNLDRRPLSVLYKVKLYDYFDVTDNLKQALALLENTETVAAEG